MNTKEQTLDAITAQFLEPLNDETRRILRPARPYKNDVLALSLNESGDAFIAHVYAILNNSNNTPYQTYSSKTALRFLTRIPQRTMITPGRFKLAMTDFTALVINAGWPKDQLKLTGDAATTLHFLLLRFLRQTQCARAYAAFKLRGELPKMPEDFIDHPEFPLANFQKVAVAAQIGLEGANLWMEQGTGKTPIVISRINYEAHKVFVKERRMHRTLVVVPKNVRTSWMKKIIQFAIHPGKVTILRGDHLNRVKQLVEAFKRDEDSEYTVIICSYETVLRSWDALRMIKWDLCCLDEAHMIKSASTKRWAQVAKLRELCKNRTGLTGTPFANNLFDIYTQLEWLGEGLSGFTNFKAFRKYYGRFLPRDGNRQFDVLTGYQNLPILQERISRLCFMITRKEALPHLPEKSYDVREVSMTPRQADFYKQLQQRLMIEIENELAANTQPKQLTANHILTKLLRLSQITAGYVKWDARWSDDGELLNENEQFEALTPNPKIDATVELIKSTESHEKIIVWCNWVPALKALSDRFTREEIKHVLYYGGTKDKDRDEAERSYNEDADIKVFLGNPAAGGVGLDLWGHIPQWDNTERDHGCDTRYVLYFSQNWSMIHRSQSEDRCIRRGTRQPVQIIDFIVPGSIDEEIAKRVLQKKLSAMELQDVRDVMKRILNFVPVINDE